MSFERGSLPLLNSEDQMRSIRVLQSKGQDFEVEKSLKSGVKLSINKSINLNKSIKARTMISGLNAWDVEEEQHKFGAELRQKNVLVNMIQIINKFRARYDKPELLEDPVLKVVAKDYSSYLINYSHCSFKLSEFCGFYDYNKVVGCFFSKTDIFIDNHESLDREKLTQNLEMALSSILKSKEDALGLLSTPHNSIGLGYALAEECISLVILTYQTPVEFTMIKNNVIGQLIFKGRIKSTEKHLERISAIDNYSSRVIKVLNKNSVKHQKDGYFELIMDPDFEYVMEKSIIQNEKANYGRLTNKGFIIEFLVQEGAPLLTSEDEEQDPVAHENSSEYNMNQTNISDSNLHGICLKIPLMNFPSCGDKNFQELFLPLRDLILKQDLNFWGEFRLDSLGQGLEGNNEYEKNKSINHNLHDPMISVSSSNSYSSFDDKSLSDEYEEFRLNSDEQNPKQKSAKDVLVSAIREGRTELKKYREINRALRERAHHVQMRRIRVNKSILEDLNVSQIKYQATLDHIHKVRQQMKVCKDQYDKTTTVLNRTLEDKMGAFNDLRRCFVNLKNEISAKAVFSSNYKKLSAELISDLEKAEEETNGRLQHIRTSVLRFKVDLDRQESEFRKKQKFENGLHLIDFEKLKIENQNLNEKMEGKNEELVKLHKKKANTVQILAHTKKKLEYEKQILLQKKNDFEKESSFFF